MGTQCGDWRAVWGFVHFISELMIAPVIYETDPSPLSYHHILDHPISV